MSAVAEMDLEALWACASPEAQQRTVDLARKISKAGAARLSSLQGRIVRCVSDPEHLLSDEGATTIALDVPIRLPSADEIGTLSVFDRSSDRSSDQSSRVWTDEDRELLGELAASLASQIELKLETEQRVKAEHALHDVNSRLLEVADRIPGLVFERRKIDAGRSHYTFFGSAKTQLPAVRKMMEDGGAGDFGFVHRDDRDLVRAAILRSNFEETDLDLTFRIRDLDRSTRWLRSQSIVRRDAEGHVFWDGLIFDISDLVAAREAAEAARSLRDNLLTEINSEMRTPLQAIIGFTDFLGTERNPERAGAHARNIRFAAESLLSAVNQLLEQTGGDVAPDRGDTVPPQTIMRNLPAPYAAPPAPQHGNGGHILLADDLDLNRKLIADMLGIEGHVVDCVANGAEALEAASRHRYDLILMDMMMPGMDGLDATRAIRALPAPTCNVPIVALTAHSLDEQLDSCLAAGMDATLTKPMSMDALNEAVSTWIRGRKAA